MAPPPFQTFLDRHGAELMRFLAALVGPDEADDCYQETCLAALRAYPGLPPGSNVRAWAFTIARHKAIDASRARARRPVPVAEAPAPPAPGAPAIAASEGRAGATPEAREEREAWDPLRVLPAKQRAAVFLRVAAELPHREVARILDCTEEAARRSAHDGLKRLREEMT